MAVEVDAKTTALNSGETEVVGISERIERAEAEVRRLRELLEQRSARATAR